MTGEKVFNTGKVAIGRLYTPTARPHHDRDALRLQSALLGHKPQTDWDGIGIVAFVLVVVVMAVIAYAIGGAA